MAEMINLNNFAEGAVAERFNMELQNVLNNLADPNTDAKKARKLTLTLTIKGNEKRDIANVDIQTKISLVPAKPIETQMIIGHDGNKVVGSELKSGIKGQTYVDVDTGEIKDDVGNDIEESPKVVRFK